MRLSEADHAQVSAAVAAAEAHTRGEIVTVVAGASDGYRDVALHWAVLAMLGTLAALATWPGVALHLYGLVAGAWADAPGPGALYLLALLVVTLVFLLVRLLLGSLSARLWLTPGTTEQRRVRRAALAHFRSAAQGRTAGATGVLLYLSLAERRAEIIADAAIHGRVAPELWGEVMADLLAGVRDGRPGDGLAAAIERIGAVLAEHFPRGEGDVNELPDRLVEL
jgi:putative membrane protein